MFHIFIHFAAKLGCVFIGEASVPSPSFLNVFFPDALLEFNPGVLRVLGDNATAGIFATYPSTHLTMINGFFDQVSPKWTRGHSKFGPMQTNLFSLYVC